MHTLGLFVQSDFIYQAIGIVALIICVLSFQIKSNKVFLLFQCVSCGLFAIQFGLGGAWAGLLLNCVCVGRCLALAFIKNKQARKIATIIICIMFAIAGSISFLVFNEKIFIAIITTTASIVGAISIATDNEKIIRYVQICFVSPCWLFNNIFFLSIGGIIAECLNVVSAAIALIRWRKEEIANKKLSS